MGSTLWQWIKSKRSLFIPAIIWMLLSETLSVVVVTQFFMNLDWLGHLVTLFSALTALSLVWLMMAFITEIPFVQNRQSLKTTTQRALRYILLFFGFPLLGSAFWVLQYFDEPYIKALAFIPFSLGVLSVISSVKLQQPPPAQSLQIRALNMLISSVVILLFCLTFFISMFFGTHCLPLALVLLGFLILCAGTLIIIPLLLTKLIRRLDFHISMAVFTILLFFTAFMIQQVIDLLGWSVVIFNQLTVWTGVHLIKPLLGSYLCN